MKTKVFIQKYFNMPKVSHFLIYKNVSYWKKNSKSSEKIPNGNSVHTFILPIANYRLRVSLSKNFRNNFCTLIPTALQKREYTIFDSYISKIFQTNFFH